MGSLGYAEGGRGGGGLGSAEGGRDDGGLGGTMPEKWVPILHTGCAGRTG